MYSDYKKSERRLHREQHTIYVMIKIYCRKHHITADALCDDCQQLFSYAMQRISNCPFKGEKPTCAKCLIHCYKPAMREQVRLVMRYAGPRMMIYHPVYAILHYLDGITKARKSKTAIKKER